MLEAANEHYSNLIRRFRKVQNSKVVHDRGSHHWNQLWNQQHRHMARPQLVSNQPLPQRNHQNHAKVERKPSRFSFIGHSQQRRWERVSRWKAQQIVDIWFLQGHWNRQKGDEPGKVFHIDGLHCSVRERDHPVHREGRRWVKRRKEVHFTLDALLQRRKPERHEEEVNKGGEKLRLVETLSF